MSEKTIKIKTKTIVFVNKIKLRLKYTGMCENLEMPKTTVLSTNWNKQSLLTKIKIKKAKQEYYKYQKCQKPIKKQQNCKQIKMNTENMKINDNSKYT